MCSYTLSYIFHITKENFNHRYIYIQNYFPQFLSERAWRPEGGTVSERSERVRGLKGKYEFKFFKKQKKLSIPSNLERNEKWGG